MEAWVPTVFESASESSMVVVAVAGPGSESIVLSGLVTVLGLVVVDGADSVAGVDDIESESLYLARSLLNSPSVATVDSNLSKRGLRYCKFSSLLKLES